jgi:branched-chain amino acid transport system substrate-binding protein
MPQAKIAVLYQNDDFGKDVFKGLREGLGAQADMMIVLADSYEVAEPTIDSHIVKLKTTGANVFINIATPKFAAQAIKKIAELGWRPTQFVSYVSSSVAGVMKPSGLDNAQGIISAAYAKEASDPQWNDDHAVQKYRAFLARYLPAADPADGLLMTGYLHAQALEYVLKQCGDNLTRQNVMKQAASIKGLTLPGMLPGITIDTAPDDFAPIERLQLVKFVGERWQRFGDVMDAGNTK